MGGRQRCVKSQRIAGANALGALAAPRPWGEYQAGISGSTGGGTQSLQYQGGLLRSRCIANDAAPLSSVFCSNSSAANYSQGNGET